MWLINVQVCILVWFISLNQLPSTKEHLVNLPCPQIVAQYMNSNHLCHSPHPTPQDIEDRSWCSAPSLGNSCNIGDIFSINTLFILWLFQIKHMYYLCWIILRDNLVISPCISLKFLKDRKFPERCKCTNVSTTEKCVLR